MVRLSWLLCILQSLVWLSMWRRKLHQTSARSSLIRRDIRRVKDDVIARDDSVNDRRIVQRLPRHRAPTAATSWSFPLGGKSRDAMPAYDANKWYSTADDRDDPLTPKKRWHDFLSTICQPGRPVVPRYRLSTYDRRAYSVPARPSGTLQVKLQDPAITVYSSSRRSLKTWLFSKY